jgi:hypothetical protein
MKIYVTNINKNNIQDIKISKYKCKTENITLILSDLGIITCRENTMVLQKIVDGPTEKKKFGEFSFICDNSYYITDRVVYQIPVSHTVETIDKTSYRLSAKSELTMVIEKSRLTQDLYFETEETIDVAFIRNDILSFLTELKFC